MSSSSKNKVTVIHCWSAPRSRSTALLYSFEARGADTIVLDEPLYREWLLHHEEAEKGLERPYKAALFQGNSGFNDVPKEKWEREQSPFLDRLQKCIAILLKTGKGGVVFVKQMAKFDVVFDFHRATAKLRNNDDDDANSNVVHRHVLLIRDPMAVLLSWKRAGKVHGNAPSLEEVGILPLLNIYSKLDGDVIILDSDDLVADPASALRKLCEDELSVEYRNEMLTWKPGPHTCDGPWAKWWYASVHESTGWAVPTKQSWLSKNNKYPILDTALLPALRASLPAYECLYHHHHSRDNVSCQKNNSDLLVYISKTPGQPGRLIPRELAGISPWDSSVLQGVRGVDNTLACCWGESLQVCNGKILALESRLTRLLLKLSSSLDQLKKKSSSSPNNNELHYHTRAEIIEGIVRTLSANGMREDTDLHIILTRGEQHANTVLPQSGTTLIVLAVWKQTNQESILNDDEDAWSLPDFQDYH